MFSNGGPENNRVGTASLGSAGLCRGGPPPCPSLSRLLCAGSESAHAPAPRLCVPAFHGCSSRRGARTLPQARGPQPCAEGDGAGIQPPLGSVPARSKLPERSPPSDGCCQRCALPDRERGGSGALGTFSCCFCCPRGAGRCCPSSPAVPALCVFIGAGSSGRGGHSAARAESAHHPLPLSQRWALHL